jgi:hypothetical protein
LETWIVWNANGVTTKQIFQPVQERQPDALPLEIVVIGTLLAWVLVSARPGCIKVEVNIDLPHPRHYTLKTSPEFSALKAHLTDEIRAEAVLAEPNRWG